MKEGEEELKRLQEELERVKQHDRVLAEMGEIAECAVRPELGKDEICE